MKYLVSLFGLIILAVIFLYINVPYKPVIITTLIVLVLVVLVAWQYSVVRRIVEGEVVIHRHKKAINIYALSVACLWTISAFLGKNSDFYGMAFMWAIVLADVITYFIYKQKKPIGLVINGEKLTINDLWVIERDLNDLTGMGLIGDETLELYFKDKPKSKIKIGDYKEMDVYFFAEFIIQTTKHAIDISDKLKQKLTYYKSTN